MTVDNHPSSRFADRVYVTWTTFAADGTGYIYEAHSKRLRRVLLRPGAGQRRQRACAATRFGLPTPQGRCNENQDSQPFTAPDGTLYVVYNNFNNVVTGNDNRNQVLLARSTNGGASFSAPVKVGDYYELPDCDTYQGAGADPGRACVPEKGPSNNSVFRASNYPIGAVDPTDPNRVVVTFGSYINRNSNENRGCTPTGFAADGINTYTGVKDGGCNNDILYSVSTNGGSSLLRHARSTRGSCRWSPTAPSSPAPTSSGRAPRSPRTAPSSRRYYDRSYGDDNTTGYSDITVSASHDRVTFAHKRATSSSMPPPTQFAGQFYGDYAGIDGRPTPRPTRSGPTPAPSTSSSAPAPEPRRPPTVCTGSAPNAPFANDQDIYTAGVAIP